MWFAEDERLLDDIVERLCSMVADLKTLIPMPTQKRAKRGSKHGHEISQSLVYMGEHPCGHFEGHLRDKGLDQPRIQSPPPGIIIIIPIIKIIIKKTKLPWKTSCGCRKTQVHLDNVEGRTMKVPLKYLHCVPAMRVHSK